MKHLRVYGAFALALFAATPGLQSAEQSIAFVHATIIDGTGGPVARDATLVVAGTRVAAVGRFGRVKIPASATVVDARGSFIIPGLWDMHVHVRGGPELRAANETLLTLYVVNGVTGIREMGGDLTDAVVQWRREIAEGTRLGPEIVTSGPKIEGVRPQWAGSMSVTTAAGARQAVLDLKQRGADFVKVYSGVNRDVFFAALDEAARQQLPVSAHLPDDILVGEASDAGLHSLEHFMYIVMGASKEEAQISDEARRRREMNSPMPLVDRYARLLNTYDQTTVTQLAARLVRNNTWIDPTLTVHRAIASIEDVDHDADPRRQYVPASIWNSWTSGVRTAAGLRVQATAFRQLLTRARPMISALHTAHVGILVGTDTAAFNPYVYPGFAVHDELAALVDAGLTPMDALQAATRDAALYLGQLSERGTIQAGKIADLVLLERNPLEDISNTRRIRSVVVHGRFLSHADVEAALKDIAARARNQ